MGNFPSSRGILWSHNLYSGKVVDSKLSFIRSSNCAYLLGNLIDSFFRHTFTWYYRVLILCPVLLNSAYNLIIKTSLLLYPIQSYRKLIISLSQCISGLYFLSHGIPNITSWFICLIISNIINSLYWGRYNFKFTSYITFLSGLISISLTVFSSYSCFLIINFSLSLPNRLLKIKFLLDLKSIKIPVLILN